MPAPEAENARQVRQMNEKKRSEARRSFPVPETAPQDRQRVSWKSLERQVVRRQQQIAQASEQRDQEAVHRLQQHLLESEAARLLAVRRAAEENQGKHTAGVDGVKSLSASARLAMAAEIHPRHWMHQPPQPARRVWIPKPGTSERRPLAILPMIDRCKQALVKMALEPEWEARFEEQSYGYRPGRGAHDALTVILDALEDRPAFVFNADIEKAFDEVSQAVILDTLKTFPLLRDMIIAWLRAGVMDAGLFFPSTKGIPQGGALSPLLLNVALHGMEAAVSIGAPVESPRLVRYADNFVLLHPHLSVLQQAILRVRTFLSSRGLHLNAQKTSLAHTLTHGSGKAAFDFLGFHLRQEASERASPGNRNAPRTKLVLTIVTPSHEADRRHHLALEQRLQQVATAPQAQVIAELNPLILGWAAYYQGLVEDSLLGRYDDRI